MLVNKIVMGCVVQTFDTDLRRYVSQEFHPAEEAIFFEDEKGKEPNDLGVMVVDGEEAVLPFDMVQPQGNAVALVQGSTKPGSMKPFMVSIVWVSDGSEHSFAVEAKDYPGVWAKLCEEFGERVRNVGCGRSVRSGRTEAWYFGYQLRSGVTAYRFTTSFEPRASRAEATSG